MSVSVNTASGFRGTGDAGEFRGDEQSVPESAIMALCVEPGGDLAGLSSNDGGLRGYFTALILMFLEQDLASAGKITGSIADMFQLLAGASTGSIIAAGLSTNKTAGDIALLYDMHGADIFHRPRWFQAIPGRTRKSGGLEDVLHAQFGARTLSQVERRLLIVAYALDLRGERGPVLLCGGPDLYASPDIELRHVVRASAAAPVRLPPASVTETGGLRHMVAIDGGLAASNPSLVAYHAMRWIAHARGRADQPRYMIVTLGAGLDNRPRTAAKAVSAAASARLSPASERFLVDQMMHAQSSMADFLLRSSPDVSHVRVDFDLEPALAAITDPRNTGPLGDLAFRAAGRLPPRNDHETRTARQYDTLLNMLRVCTPQAF